MFAVSRFLTDFYNSGTKIEQKVSKIKQKATKSELPGGLHLGVQNVRGKMIPRQNIPAHIMFAVLEFSRLNARKIM